MTNPGPARRIAPPVLAYVTGVVVLVALLAIGASGAVLTLVPLAFEVVVFVAMQTRYVLGWRRDRVTVGGRALLAIALIVFGVGVIALQSSALGLAVIAVLVCSPLVLAGTSWTESGSEDGQA